MHNGFMNDLFKKRHSDTATMEIVIIACCVVGVAIVLAVLCRCCRGNKYRGRVLQPAPDPNSSVPAPPGAAPYPQQQYSTVTVTTLPVGHVGAAYPAAGAPYPGGGVPYPGAAPYPMAGAPYPAVAPYPSVPFPSGMPQPVATGAPSAPDAHTLPPSYEQVMSNEAKHPPYNPYAPH